MSIYLVTEPRILGVNLTIMISAVGLRNLSNEYMIWKEWWGIKTKLYFQWLFHHRSLVFIWEHVCIGVFLPRGKKIQDLFLNFFILNEPEGNFQSLWPSSVTQRNRKKKKKAERYIGAPRGHSGRDHHSVNLIGKKITSMFFHIYRNIIVI